jgi:predicted enzyme related to lactoylglutathione lyase
MISAQGGSLLSDDAGFGATVVEVVVVLVDEVVVVAGWVVVVGASVVVVGASVVVVSAATVVVCAPRVTAPSGDATSAVAMTRSSPAAEQTMARRMAAPSESPKLARRPCARTASHSASDGASIGHMAIIGTHCLLYTSEPEAVRELLRDVFGWQHVDAGEGWLIFAAPPAEMGVHPTEGPGQSVLAHHQVSLMRDDLEATLADLRERGVEVAGEPRNAGYGIVATLRLPGGLDMDLYQPRHPTAI